MSCGGGSYRDLSVCRHYIVTNGYNLQKYTKRVQIIYFTVNTFSGVPRNFVRAGGVSTNSVEDRGQSERGSGGGSPLVRGSGDSCNLVQEISFHIVKIFLIFGTLRLFMMTTNLFVIANANKLRT